MMNTGTYKEVNESRFELPDMSVYYDEDLIEEFTKLIDKDDPKKVAYYMEEPFTTHLGFHEREQAFVLKAKPVIAKTDTADHCTGQKQEELNMIDADTISFYLEDEFSDGGNAFVVNNKTYKGFKDYAYQTVSANTFKNKIFKIRTIGINAPEVVHYSTGPVAEAQLLKKIKELTYEEIKAESGIVYEINKKREPGTKYGFIKVNGKWREIKDYKYKKTNSKEQLLANIKANGFYGRDPYYTAKDFGDSTKEHPNTYYFIFVDKDEQTKADMDGDINLGMAAKEKALELLNMAYDIRIVIDANQLHTGIKYSELHSLLQEGWNSDKSMEENINALYVEAFGDHYVYGGYNTFGQDSYKRFLGAIYVKANLSGAADAWINLAKYVRAEVGDCVKLMTGITPATLADNNGLSDAFKLWSYDDSRTVIADGLYGISQADFDDRREIQKQITGMDFEQYKDYTVMIGDCLFMVPPTSIRVVNQIESNRVPLLRTKGSMLKTLPHNERVIEMTLYFNGDHGINGVPVKRQLPAQKGTNQYETYYMNGLRSLIAMFKTTPFLPIENSYLNNTLNIEAVALANIQVQTMPMYPQCLAVTLTLQDFNYRVYMNELPVPDPEKGESYNKNMFATTINYGVMRHYYQKGIKAGEAIKYLDTGSQEFIEETMGGKTKLIPMAFQDQRISFKIIDETWLDKMKRIKELASKQSLNQLEEISQPAIKWLEGVGITLGNILNMFKNEDSRWTYRQDANSEGSFIAEFYKQLTSKSNCPYLGNITPGGESYSMVVTFNTDSLTSGEIANISKAISKELNLDSSNDEVFKNGSLKLQLNGKSDYSEKATHYSLNKSCEGYKVAEFCAIRSGALSDVEIGGGWADFSAVANEAFAQDLKDNGIDNETILSAKFKEYPVDELVVQNFSVSMGNALARTYLKSEDGYAAQYTGGQDTVLEFVMNTTSEATVAALNSMQETAIEALMKYKNIISCWPLRIESELTRLCGIYEVAIESIDISTVPNQPGLFAIHVRAISVDRTLRNKESLNRLKNINNAGAITQTGQNSLTYKTYFDLNNALAQAELYPDLDLPTIDELEATGYRYIKYSKNRNGRIYPDPDFYFVYGHAYTSQILRKLIVEYFQANDNEDNAMQRSEFQFYTDDNVQELISKAVQGSEVLSFQFKDNEAADEYQSILERNKDIIAAAEIDAEKRAAKQKVLDDSKELYDIAKMAQVESTALMLKSWDVCEDIKVTLPETNSIMTEDTEFQEAIKTASEKIIEIIDDVLKHPIDASKCEKAEQTEGWSYEKHLCKRIKKFIAKEFDEGGTWYKILEAFDSASDENWLQKALSFVSFGWYDGDNTDNDVIGAIYEAAAMALSGNSEYSDGADKDSYVARAFFTNKMAVGFKTNPNSKIIDSNTGQVFIANSIEKAIEDGVTFGPYQITRYNTEYLNSFYNLEKVSFGEEDFIDPYYNKVLHKKNFNGEEIDQTEYKKNMMLSTDYSIQAFHRVVLVWLKKLIQDQNFFSYYDIKRGEYLNKIQELIKSAKEKTESATADDKAQVDEIMSGLQNGDVTLNEDESEVFTNYNLIKTGVNNAIKAADDVKDLMEDYDECLVAGKVFLAVCCAAVHGDYSIYGKISARDISTLKSKTVSATRPVLEAELSIGERYFRKFIRGLAGGYYKLIDGLEDVARKAETELEKEFSEQSSVSKLWVSANDDPGKWILHSFYDMVTNNKRGRMARAFPTYYMLLIDEGRQIGYWKLHDNFYNMSAISEMEIVKSRKIAADTARIVMSNMYGTFTTDDEDIKTDYTHNIMDVFNSIFSPNIAFDEEERRRLGRMEINNVKLQPGVRLHIRMGYSGNASELPVLFNGVAAEVSTGDVIEIVAQGDGHELANDQAFYLSEEEDLADLENEDSFILWKWLENMFTTGSTSKQLLQNILTSKGTWSKDILNKISKGALFNNNRFGIVHFGEIDYVEIHENGEVMQNIYEGNASMPWHHAENKGTLTSQYSEQGSPVYTMDIRGKSVWDIMHICASTSSEYITSTAPFALRSTIFHGRPHYYYAYDYVIDQNGLIKERRKPFQQYHIIDSYSDIIGNSIKANGKNVKTVAVPMYKGPGWVKSGVDKQSTTLYADFDIYPEYQKTMVVNTEIEYKKNILGSVAINLIRDNVSKKGGKKLAWRMGAAALKDSFRDMYEGEVTIIGDPSIKPYDKVYLNDIYEDMNGAFDVEAVVFNLNTETGFTTSIYPDCISSVDNRYEKAGQMWTSQIVSNIALYKSINYLEHLAYGRTTKPMLNIIAKSTGKGINNLRDTINKVSQFVGKDELIKYSQLEDWYEKFCKTVNISPNEIKAFEKVERVKGAAKILKEANFTNLESARDISRALSALSKAADDMDVTDLINILKNSSNKDSKEVKKAIKELEAIQASLDVSGITKSAKSFASEAIKNIDDVANLTKAEKEALSSLKAILKSDAVDAKTLKTLTGNLDDLSRLLGKTDEMAKIAKAIGKHGDDLAKVAKAGGTAVTGAGITGALAGAIVSVTGAPAIVATALVVAAELAIQYVLEKSVYSMIENTMASFNVLTVYPLKKKGTVMVAGIDGHKGTVVGSPTYNVNGPIENAMIWACKDRAGLWGWFLDTFVISDEMKAIANSYKKDTNGQANEKEDSIQSLLKSIGESQVSSISRFKSLAAVDRLQDASGKSPNSQYTFNKIKVVATDFENIAGQQNIIDNFIPISNKTEVLANYFDKGMLVVAADMKQEGYDAPKIEKAQIAFQFSSVGNATLTCMAINKKAIQWDIPMLRADAFQVFNRIMELASTVINERPYGEIENCKVCFCSGTITNEASWNSTGQAFRFKILGLFKPEVDEILENMKAELREEAVNQGKEFDVVQYRYIIESASYEVYVSPRDELLLSLPVTNN